MLINPMISLKSLKIKRILDKLPC